MTSTAGFEPGPHWWEASAFTTAPSLAARRPTECEVLTDRPKLGVISPIIKRSHKATKNFLLHKRREKVQSIMRSEKPPYDILLVKNLLVKPGIDI